MRQHHCPIHIELILELNILTEDTMVLKPSHTWPSLDLSESCYHPRHTNDLLLNDELDGARPSLSAIHQNRFVSLPS